MTEPDVVPDEAPEQRDCRNCGEAALPYSDYCHDCYWGRRDDD